jgi:hypothetical protein
MKYGVINYHTKQKASVRNIAAVHDGAITRGRFGGVIKRNVKPPPSGEDFSKLVKCKYIAREAIQYVISSIMLYVILRVNA